MCGHWNFRSIILAVSQWPDREFVKCLEWKTKQQKNTKHLSWSLQIGSELGHYVNANPVCLNVTLAFTSWLHGAQRSAKGASLESFKVFSENTLFHGHVLFMPDVPIYMVTLQSPYFFMYLCPQSPPFQAFRSICFPPPPFTVPCSRQPQVVYVFKCFQWMLLGKLLHPEGGKKKVSFSTGPSGNHETGKNSQLLRTCTFWEQGVYCLPLAPAPHQKCDCCPQAGEWEMVNT